MGSPSPLPCEGQDWTPGLGTGGNTSALDWALGSMESMVPGAQVAGHLMCHPCLAAAFPPRDTGKCLIPPWVPALGLIVLLGQEVASSEAAFR